MSYHDKPAPDDSRGHKYMESWFRLGDTAEGLEECRQYIYRTAPLSPSCLMCVVQAARDAMRARDAEIARLRAELNEAKQGTLVYAGGCLVSIFDFILRFVAPKARVAALRVPAEVEVFVAPNNFGGWSIFAANDRARGLLGGDEPTGNFGTHADAYRRAHDHNCWQVVEAPTLPGIWASRACTHAHG